MSRYCSECGKARKACLCPSIVALESAVELIILQHPTEQKRPLGTARILSLSLANCRLLVGEDFREHDELNQLLAEPDVDYYVLYPNEHAQECTKISLTTARKTRVILLDGTWKKPTRCGKSTLNCMTYRAYICRTSVLGITEFVKRRMIQRFPQWRRVIICSSSGNLSVTSRHCSRCLMP